VLTFLTITLVPEGTLSTQAGTEDVSLPMRVGKINYDIIPLTVRHEYAKHLMKDVNEAAKAIESMRYGMCREIAEQIFDLVEFRDEENYQAMTVVMQADIRILRRKP
jgi:hypothetical protein